MHPRVLLAPRKTWMPATSARLSGSSLHATSASLLLVSFTPWSSSPDLFRRSTCSWAAEEHVDDRDKPGHDESEGWLLRGSTTDFAQPDSRATSAGMTTMKGRGSSGDSYWRPMRGPSERAPLAREMASRSMRNPSGPSIQISTGCCARIVQAKSTASAGTA